MILFLSEILHSEIKSFELAGTDGRRSWFIELAGKKIQIRQQLKMLGISYAFTCSLCEIEIKDQKKKKIILEGYSLFEDNSVIARDCDGNEIDQLSISVCEDCYKKESKEYKKEVDKNDN